MKAHVILLISTDPQVITTVEDAVFSQRHGLRVVADREGAMRELAGNDIDLVILDRDPDILDLDLLRTVRGRVPVLALATREPELVDGILRRDGIGVCLAKSPTGAALSAAVHALLMPKTAEA